MFVEEFTVIDAHSPLWSAARPLLDVALQLDQQDASYIWHGWGKAEIETFLQGLPAHCTLLLGVWESENAGPLTDAGENVWVREALLLGCVCEIVDGAVRSLRTFEALAGAGLPSLQELEPGYQHALDLISAARKLVAPVAWALFTDKATWDEWLLTPGMDTLPVAKGQALAALAQQGRCVLLGNQATHQHHYL